MGLGTVLGALFGTANGKGFIGETKVALGAFIALPRSTYQPFRNVILEAPDGTTQIDHIFVSRFGVFVVETKNMGGWIFGNESDRQWTQAFRNGQKFRFQNPLRQNYRHTEVVEKAFAPLRLPRGAVHSVVAFVGRAELKTELPANVTTGIGFASYVRSFRDVLLTSTQVDDACGMLESKRLLISDAEHRRNVRDLKGARANPASRICPKCGKGLTLRTARKGRNAGERFWGCSGYPKCRYTAQYRP